MVSTLLAVLLAAPVAVDTKALLADLSVIARSHEAVEALVKQGAPAVPGLTGIAVEGSDLTQRGWAIVALSRINTAPAVKALEGLPGDSKQPALVRTWAAAALIKNAKDLSTLVALQKWTQSYPATRR